MLSGALRWIGWLYIALGVIAVVLIPASANGWFGIAPDPLSGVFALIFAMPWSLILGHFASGDSAVAGASICVIGIAINAAILFWLARKLAPKPA